MDTAKNNILIIIPAFNEEGNIAGVLDAISRKSLGFDVLVVDDGSTDNTREYALKSGAIVLSHPFNMGIGTSFQTGCRFALEHDYACIVRMDGDGQHDPSFINTLLYPVKNMNADIVVGSRFLNSYGLKHFSLRRVGVIIISFTLRLITKKKFTDPTSGFCAMNRKAYMFFAEHCAEDYPEPEIFIHHYNFVIKEVPVFMNERISGQSSINSWKTIYYMYKVLLSLFLSIFNKGRE